MTATLPETTLHASLVRPVLLAGAERELALLNLVAIFALVFGVGPHPLSWGSAVVLGTVGHGLLVRAAKADPQAWRVFTRHVHYRDVYLASAAPEAPSGLVQPFASRS